MKFRKDKGQFLIELLVALTLSVMIIVAVVGLSAVSVKTAYRAKQDTQAKRLADEAIEWLRSKKKENWYSFYSKANGGYYCLNSLTWPPPTGACTNYSGLYKRDLRLDGYLGSGKEKVKAAVIVSWKDNQGDHNVTLTTIFTSEE